MSSRNVYKITIRQLVSIKRLSESLAKVHTNLQIIAAYVYEATILLRYLVF